MATKKKDPELMVQDEAEDMPAEETPTTGKISELEKAKAEIEALKKQLAAKPVRSSGKESDYDMVHRIEREAAEQGTDPWTIKVEVLVPHREKTEDPWYWINVNGLSVQIPANDRYQEMKLPWACVLVDQLVYQKQAIDYQESLEVYDPETNPHK